MTDQEARTVAASQPAAAAPTTAGPAAPPGTPAPPEAPAQPEAPALPGAPASPGVPAPPDTPAPPRPAAEPRRWPKSFADRLADPLPGMGDLLRVIRECAVRPPAHTLADVASLPVAPAPVPEAGPATVSVTWAGHASWVIRIGGLTVLTDPVWSRRIPATPARITPVGVPWEELPPVDAVVISHNHYDHLDAPTLKRLPRDTALFVPAGLGVWCRRRGFVRVTELDWWEAAELSAVRFDFVPAHHWSRRTLTDACRSLWGGWVLSDPAGRRVYFAGDTGYGPFFREVGRVHPGIDLALLPIGAYAPRWMLSPVHTDPEEAVRAFLDIGAAAMAPMHWATFLLSGEPPLEPLTRLLAAWRAAGLGRDALWDLPVGGSRVLAA
jgi:L-ascorbate metabolism protein UlaG (beta-lactamase superfamily)